MKTQSYISKINELLRLALEAKLLLDDLKKEWPMIEDNSKVIKILYEDLEEAVIHVPSFMLTKKIDYKMWYSQYERKVLACDFHLMPYIGNSELWMELREKLINGSDDWTFDSIKINLEKLLKN